MDDPDRREESNPVWFWNLLFVLLRYCFKRIRYKLRITIHIIFVRLLGNFLINKELMFYGI
jgi:hypothetical protein